MNETHCSCGHCHTHEHAHTHTSACCAESTHEAHTHGHTEVHEEDDGGGDDPGGCHHEHCTCGHDHDHAHEHDGCACGHEHTTGKASKWMLPTAAGLFVVGLLCAHVFSAPTALNAVIFGVSAVLAGHTVFLDGVKNLFKLHFTENVLMSIAVVTAFCLGEFAEAAAVAILFNLGELAEEIAERNSRRSITALTEIRPDTARVLRGGAEAVVSPSAVAVGETVVVRPFERLPLDGVVLEGNSYIDNAALTGESVPVEVAPGDTVLSGAVNGSAAITLRVTRAFEDSTASRILKMIESSGARKGNAEKLITRFAKIYTPIVLVLALLVTVVPPLLGWGDITVWLKRALVMLVASCPCALVISVPLGFFAGIGVQSKLGMLIKGGKYLEALAKVDAVALDKTGTITTGALSVSAVHSMTGLSESEILKRVAAAEALSTHPVALAVRKAAGETAPAEDIRERAGRGVEATVSGKKLLVGRAAFLEENGISTAALPPVTVAVAEDGVLLGGILLGDTVKPDSAEAVSALRAMGVREVVMLTGDNEQAAKRVAEQVGTTAYRAGLLPADKAAFVEQLPGVRVFVGDGVNDAPVLAAADCGVAIGLGSEAAIETADAVLSSGNLSVLPRAVKLARRSMRVIYANILFALAVKAAVLICSPFGIVPMWVGVFADVGVTVLAVLNTLRILRFKY